MNSQQKKKHSLVLGILSIVASLLLPVLGIVLGVLTIIEANSRQKESGLDYKTERVLAIIGIVVSVINWVAGIILMSI